ncbi:hypothetical protein [Nonomuraea polychroma]|uniref:hypothetical protein n=1 Tax=Nonomuraea polychroma TaxID=46176 RepID=UPI0019D4B673|nr:hypothetical protein [Nonomuraea polychroma]
MPATSTTDKVVVHRLNASAEQEKRIRVLIASHRPWAPRHEPALPNWTALERLAKALMERSKDGYEGWGEVVIFAACTAARIG